MFKYIFSFKFGNIHPTGTTSTTSNTFNAADKPVVKGGNDEGTVKESPSIQSVRQQRRQQLEEMALIRKIAHQSFMSQYAVDHLPLSQVQEKLEEENVPLIQLQQKLKQTDDNLTVYTTTKENLRSLFYNQRRSHGLLMKPRKFRPTNRKDHHNNNNNNNVDDNSNPTKDDRDYDVWDDAVIGRIMNLVDTIGIEPGEAIQETHSTDEGSTFSANVSGNAEEKSDSKDREMIVAENVQEDCETQPVEAAEEATKYDEPDDHEGSTGKRNATIIRVTTLTTTTSAERPDGLTRHSSYVGSMISIEIDNKRERRESGFWKRNSILSPSSLFFSNKEQNHSGFSGSDDDLIDQRSIVSVTAKVSIDDFDDRNKKSIPFLKKLWKPKRQKDQTKKLLPIGL